MAVRQATVVAAAAKTAELGDRVMAVAFPAQVAEAVMAAIREVLAAVVKGVAVQASQWRAREWS